MSGGIDKAITVAFAPQVTPVYMFTLLLAQNPGANPAALAVAVVFAALIPAASLLAYARLSRLDYQVKDPRRRNPLFISAAISYAIGLVLLLYLHAPFIASALMLAYVVNITAAGLINFFDKVSVHVWGISGPSVALFYVYGYPVLAALIALAAVVGVSRIRIKAHTPLQVVSAILVSVPLTFLVVYFLAPLLFSL